MKKCRLILVISVVLVILVVSLAFFKMKTKAKNAYANIKIESTSMPAIYHELVEKSDPFTLYGRNDEMIPILEKRLEKDPGNLQLKFTLGLQKIYNGDSQEGATILESLEKDNAFMQNADYIKANDKGWSKVDSLESFIALAYLRMGEQQNCIDNRNDASCVFPILGTGIHTNKKPVEVAIDRYAAILEKNPQ